MAKRRTAKTGKQKRKQLPGVALELEVARIQQLMDPNSTVSHDEWIVDRLGNERQFDVVIRGSFGGQPMLGVIECKDHNRKKGPADVEAFAKKSEHVGANLRMIVSRKGFTLQALRLARHEHIGCLSLIPKDPNQVGWAIGTYWFGYITEWRDLRYWIKGQPALMEAAKALQGPTDPDSILWHGVPFHRCLLQELLTNWISDKEAGLYRFQARFEGTQELEIGGNRYPIVGVNMEAHWRIRKKRTWVTLTGGAFYDWHANGISVPGNTEITSSAVETNLFAWDDYQGEIPQTPEAVSKQRLGMTMILRSQQSMPPGWITHELPFLRPIQMSGPI